MIPLSVMHSQVYPYLETSIGMLPAPLNGPVVDYSLFEDPSFGGLMYEPLANGASGTPGPHLFEWPAYSPTADTAPINLTMPPLPMGNPSFSLAPPPPPLPQEQESPPPRHSRRKWYCSVCERAFRDKYECERHIDNVGKRAKCLACGKTLCARKDNQKRHYTKYCMRMDLGKDTGLGLEDVFIDL